MEVRCARAHIHAHLGQRVMRAHLFESNVYAKLWNICTHLAASYPVYQPLLLFLTRSLLFYFIFFALFDWWCCSPVRRKPIDRAS